MIYLILILWIVICTVGSAVQRLNKWGLANIFFLPGLLPRSLSIVNSTKQVYFVIHVCLVKEAKIRDIITIDRKNQRV